MNKAFENCARTFAQAAATGQWEVAEAAARKLAGLQPDNASLHYNLGLVLRRRGREMEATAALNEALRLDPGHHNARFELGCALIETGDLAGAATCLDDYLKASPKDLDARLNAARIALRLGDLDSAGEHLGHLPLENGDVHLLRAELARERADINAMRHHLAEAVRLEPAQKPAALKLANQGPAGRLPLDSRKLFASS